MIDTSATWTTVRKSEIFLITKRHSRPRGLSRSSRHRCRVEPTPLDAADHAEEIVQFSRLGDVAVRVEAVGLLDILRRGRGGHYDHRDALQVGICLDLAQHLPAVLSGKIQVQQY